MREHLFSVTAKDCKFIAQRGQGKGGQKKNKTNSAIICKHEPSGAEGYAEDSRSQIENKQLAFKRMAESKTFQSWLKMEISRQTGELKTIEEKVENQMNPRFIKEEYKNEKGLWEENND